MFADTRLSIEAKGVLGYLLSRPHKWHVRLEHVARALKVGRRKLQRIFRELIGAGYVTREPRRFVAGHRFGDLDYVVRDAPLALARPVETNRSGSKRDLRLHGSERDLHIKTLRRSEMDLLIKKPIKMERANHLVCRKWRDRKA